MRIVRFHDAPAEVDGLRQQRNILRTDRCVEDVHQHLSVADGAHHLLQGQVRAREAEWDFLGFVAGGIGDEAQVERVTGREARERGARRCGEDKQPAGKEAWCQWVKAKGFVRRPLIGEGERGRR